MQSLNPRRRTYRRALGVLMTMSALCTPTAAAQVGRVRDSVSVAPGVRLPAANAGASRAIVDSADVRTASALTFSELMQGRGASVDVMMSGGRLVDGGHFLIRGPSTIVTGGAPMLIVDGMRMAEQEDDRSSTSSRLDDIAIEDIARVEVLRGPTAAALYGTGASSGVIVVTTKRGHAGRLRARVRAQSELRQDGGDYTERYRRRPVGSTAFSCNLVTAAARLCVPGAVERWSLSDAGIFRNGFGGVTSLDIAGGTNTRDARLSTTIRRANGITSGDRLSQVAARLNATQRVGHWLEVTGRVAYYGNETLGSLAGEVIRDSPFYSQGAAPVDALRMAAERYLSSPLEGHLDHLTAGGELTIRPTRWLTLRGASSRDHVSEAGEQLSSSRFPTGDGARYPLRRWSGWNTDRTHRATAEATIPLPEGMRAEVNVIAGGEHESRRRYQADANENFRELEVAYSHDATFGLGHVTVYDRLALTVGARREREIHTSSDWSVHPTGSVSFRAPFSMMATEPRFRAAYGESAQRYATSTSPFLTGVILPPSLAGLVPQPPMPPPERMKEAEVGVDMDWGRRGGFAFTVYRRTVANVVSGRLPNTVFDLSSSGVELDAHVAIVQRTSLRWDVRAVVATNANRVTTGVVSDVASGAGFSNGYPFGVVHQKAFSFSDANGDGAISYNETMLLNGVERHGGSTPTFSLALHSGLQLGRGLTVSAVVDRRTGAWAESQYARFICGAPEDSCRAHQDPATSPADQARANFVRMAFPFVAFDASFTRLREVSLRWTPFRGRSIAGAQAMRFAFSGRDLATWTSWPGPDPEISSNVRGAITRSDAVAVPLPRRFTLGVEFDY